jgi:hypothetical protein
MSERFYQRNVIFFDLLREKLEKVKSEPLKVFNVDETGIIIVQHKPNTIVNMKGKKQVSNLTSAESRSMITLSTCMLTSGTDKRQLLCLSGKI